MATNDREIDVHKTWLGLLQPVGLVVSPAALVRGQAVPKDNVVELQQTLLQVAKRPTKRDPPSARTHVEDLVAFFEQVLDWDRADLQGPWRKGEVPAGLQVRLETYGEDLVPTYALVDHFTPDRTLMLVTSIPRGADLDAVPEGLPSAAWQASPQAKFERLLTGTNVRVGLLTNGEVIRFVHTPEHQTSGHLTFPIQAMCEIGGRPILAAFHMLLRRHCVSDAPDGKRLHDLLAESRKYQNEVSTQLADQVLGALWELLRGFQAANEHAAGRLLPVATAEEREHVYGGLLTSLLRLVFLLYAEDQGLLPGEQVWVRNYSVAGLYTRLRDDHAMHPDTMDQRYGAWSSLLALVRLVYHGGAHAALHLPARKGQLFDPDAYPFLEGRARNTKHGLAERIEAPKVSDGCIYRVLHGLLVLDGERLSYRALDVEQIGSVYEAMMGHSVERFPGHSLAVKLSKKGVPGFVVFDVDELLAQPAAARAKWLKESTECEPSAKGLAALKQAKTPDEVFAALDRKVSPRTPRALPPGALVLQPSAERRRSGSHYTPRELTQPIVETTLRPVLKGLGESPRPQQILDLKVCDPAMGSGAFLVETCRQLAKVLVECWKVYACTPVLPPDEGADLHAKRLIAQQCLYGVDKNPFAVNLAKLSLWLVTLAKDHPFTFVDHALRHGDSLVGLTRDQIVRFHWDVGAGKPMPLLERTLKAETDTARARRTELEGLGDGNEDAKRTKLAEAELALADPRLAGDLVIAAFFSGDKAAEREQKLAEFRAGLDRMRAGKEGRAQLAAAALDLRRGLHPIPPFHWEIEFPEVFGGEHPGFDAIVGNPPFLGGTMISSAVGTVYLGLLRALFVESGDRMDLVAYFFRRSFQNLRTGGSLGLIATNSIGQGDTRSGGLAHIRRHGGWVYSAVRRLQWPGVAAVVVSIVHIRRAVTAPPPSLDGHPVPRITAFLFHAGGDDDPDRLRVNEGLSFKGSEAYGQGFLFDDADPKASPLCAVAELVDRDPRNASRIVPYIGGEELNNSPTLQPHRFCIDFGNMSEEQARAWPDLMRILEQRVRPERATKARDVAAWPWWRFWRSRPELYAAVAPLPRTLAVCRHQPHWTCAFLPARMVYSEALVIVAVAEYSAFAALQARPHEIWARFFGSSMKDDLRYTPSDVFETFPFPDGWRDHPALEVAGKAYYDFRAALMVQRNEGLTKTYNRLHDPEERSPDIVRLRELHDAMDRAVLDAYGWANIRPKCEFLLDYEIDEEEWGNKKKPYRYRWPDDVRDEVLGRLLELNRQRAEEERLAGPAPKKVEPAKAKIKPLPRAKQVAEDTPLFGRSDAGDER
jgi:hypothetical protein